jgi:Nif-specific regulatory protein
MKKMANGTITIVNPLTKELEIEVACGSTPAVRRKGRYKLGEGITGRVVACGEPVIVPQIAEEPLFLNRTGMRSEEQKQKSSFICVPIKEAASTANSKAQAESLAVGALSVDRCYEDDFGLQSERDLRFLTIVSGLIAQAAHRMQRVNREKELLRRENQQLRQELSAKNRINGILGNSSRMQEVFALTQRVADSKATVLLRGESGTGKSMVAKALHHNSSRAKKPFVVINCSALPETLLESELFGHEKGAFTGAVERKAGRFEQAQGGTLFLDEIGEISTTVQVKLLNVIQERVFQRLGGIELLKADIRLVAATNRDLEAAMREGKFREDLYYRLNVFPIYLPPLRERRTDILLLAEHFLEQYSQENKKKIERISTSAIDLLVKYHWPGNVRELQNCMERAVLICDSSAITSVHLPPTLQSAESVGSGRPLSFGQAVENFERDLIIEALKQSNGNQTKAAERLETSLRIINYKIHNYGIEPKQYKVK